MAAITTRGCTIQKEIKVNGSEINNRLSKGKACVLAALLAEIIRGKKSISSLDAIVKRQNKDWSE